MAEAGQVAPNAELLEWPKKDKRRFLHVVYRVGDLDRTIKYVFETLILIVLCKIGLCLVDGCIFYAL